MKLSQKIALATAGVAILGFVRTAPAAAAEFLVDGKFTDSSTTSPEYSNGYFIGTYFIDDSASYTANPQAPTIVDAPISKWDIKLFSATNSQLREISSATPNWEANKRYFDQPDNVWGFILANSASKERFEVVFKGAAPTPQTQVEPVFLTGEFDQPFSTKLATIQTGSSISVAVPQPNDLPGVFLLGLFGLGCRLRKKIASSPRT